MWCKKQFPIFMQKRQKPSDIPLFYNPSLMYLNIYQYQSNFRQYGFIVLKQMPGTHKLLLLQHYIASKVFFISLKNFLHVFFLKRLRKIFWWENIYYFAGSLKGYNNWLILKQSILCRSMHSVKMHEGWYHDAIF